MRTRNRGATILVTYTTINTSHVAALKPVPSALLIFFYRESSRFLLLFRHRQISIAAIAASVKVRVQLMTMMIEFAYYTVTSPPKKSDSDRNFFKMATPTDYAPKRTDEAIHEHDGA